MYRYEKRHVKYILKQNYYVLHMSFYMFVNMVCHVSVLAFTMCALNEPGVSKKLLKNLLMYQLTLSGTMSTISALVTPKCKQ